MTILGGISSFIKTDTEYLIKFDTGEQAKINILNSHVFKYYMSPTGAFQDFPTPNNPTDIARITVKNITDYDTKAFEYSILLETDKHFNIYTNKILIRFNKKKGTLSVQDLRTKKDVVIEIAPLFYDDYTTKQTLQQLNDEYFFGGGMQNGRFSHKEEKIQIVNTNNWVDGGVTSPCPFYWSTKGYGVLRNTWQPGVYDFGTMNPNILETVHKESNFDAFFFINSNPEDILKDYYELTGKPIFMPEFAFYEAHLNAFNRDYWVKVDMNTPRAILFEDGFYYRCYQPKDMGDKVGILESLNGEKDNYQFSARGMIDRYERHDMPLGWFIPNDGYGSGYGQTDSLKGDIENLRQFAEYSRKKGVETALWTESNLEPEDPENPKKGDRDLKNEVRIAGVAALKCDVAWIGYGYSFALNAVENAAKLFTKGANHKSRTMIIMVDGWAGTQRHAGIWSGDQRGGEWEYIRFHIPTYIGSGLSGIPIVGSDMDGIYGGGVKNVNIRDYQWKVFTPLQLSMDGWGNTQKTPFIFGEEATKLNRASLKLKSMLMPYNYTISYKSTHGLPMIRAMFLEFPEERTGYTTDSEYQYMWGPYILVAPVYNEEYNVRRDMVRHGVYLPDPNQIWIDLITGEKYQGGKIWNNINTPLWKIPVFVKDGAIIPMVNPNNNCNEIKRDQRIFEIYPNGESSFEVYEDDGKSTDYLQGQYAETKITVIGPPSNCHGEVYIHVHKTKGVYQNMVKERSTLFRIMASADISDQHIKATINDDTIEIPKVATEEEFHAKETAYYFNNEYKVNPYLENVSGYNLERTCIMIKVKKIDVTKSNIHIKVKGFENKGHIFGGNTTLNKSLKAPTGFTVLDEDITPEKITLRWDKEEDVYYEIERDGTLFTNILDTEFTFDKLQINSEHKFRIRSANDEGVSKWSYIITVSTKDDLHKSIVRVAKVICNYPSRPWQDEESLLSDEDTSPMSRTDLATDGDQAGPTEDAQYELKFDLGALYNINKIEYHPKKDTGYGTILRLQYKFSIDAKEWSPMSKPIDWNHDEAVKTIALNNEPMRYVWFNVLNAVGGYGTGKHILFYKTDI